MKITDHICFFAFSGVCAVVSEVIIYIFMYFLLSYRKIASLIKRELVALSLKPRLNEWFGAITLNDEPEIIRVIRICSVYLSTMLSCYLFLDGQARALHAIFSLLLIISISKIIQSSVFEKTVFVLTSGVKALALCFILPIYYTLILGAKLCKGIVVVLSHTVSRAKRHKTTRIIKKMDKTW